MLYNRISKTQPPCNRPRSFQPCTPCPRHHGAYNLHKKLEVFRSYFRSENDTPPSLREDWREFRAKLVKSDYALREQRESQARKALALKTIFWSHPTQVLEKGCVLLANSKTSFEDSNDLFYKSVILLLEYGPSGALGIMLNRPTPSLLGRKHGGVPPSMTHLTDGAISLFSDNRLFKGGPTELQMLTVMHGHEGLWGSSEIIPGVFVGGVDTAAELVREGNALPEDFKFYEGGVFWAPGELDEQVSQGLWNLAACSRHLILRDALDLRAPLWIEIQERMGCTGEGVGRPSLPGDDDFTMGLDAQRDGSDLEVMHYDI